MSFTADVATDVGKVRLIISDQDERYPVFQDEDIQAFLTLAGDVRRAAAEALDTMASNQTMVLKVIRTLDLSTDGAATARSLREHAKSLREQADQADAASGSLFEVAELDVNAFTAREILRNRSMRL
jgi:hypothetical protein